MFARLSRHAAGILGIMRILYGIMMACHGAQKVLGAFGGVPPGVPPFIQYGAGAIELVGGILLALGLFTRPTAFLLSGLMAVAYFKGHAPKGFWPVVNQGELAIIYSWLALWKPVIPKNAPGPMMLAR